MRMRVNKWLCGSVLVLPVIWLATGCGGGAEAPKGAAKTTAPSVEKGEPAEPAEKGEETKSETSAEPQAAEGWGGIKGRVVYVGTAPEQPQIEVPANVEFCKDHTIVDQSLIVNPENNGIKNVFIYMHRARNIAPDLADAPAEPAVLDQQYCTFIPHAQVIRVIQGGPSLKVKSNDPTRHNTHTRPSPRNPEFNQILVPNERTGVDVTINRPENRPFHVQCDIHPWMSAWILPLDHPYGVVTDENGNFEISELPAGTQELLVWHERKPNDFINQHLEVTIKAGETVDLGNIEVPADWF